MGLLGKVIQGIIDVAATPIDVAKDIITLGGTSTEQEEPYTLQKMKKLKKKAEEIYDSLDED